MAERLEVHPLEAGAFSEFGEVIAADEAVGELVNDGWARKFAQLAAVDVRDEAAVEISIFRARPRDLPLTLELLERHPLGSQAFIPMATRRFLVVVAGNGEVPRPKDLRAFVTSGGQGVNFHVGVWHHPLIALDEESDFLVVDRLGDGNLETIDIASWQTAVDLR